MGEERSCVLPIVRQLPPSHPYPPPNKNKTLQKSKKPNGIHELVQHRTSVSFVNWKHTPRPYHRRRKHKKINIPCTTGVQLIAVMQHNKPEPLTSCLHTQTGRHVHW